MKTVSITALAASLLALIVLGIYTYYQHTVIASQGSTIRAQAEEVVRLNKDIKTREVVAIKRKAAQSIIERESEDLKGMLSESLSDNVCNSVSLPDDTNRLLTELYSSGPR